MQIAAIIYVVLAIILAIGMFVRSRTREGIPVFKLTQRDRSDMREIRREINIRRVLARLLGGFASVSFFAGVLSLFHKNKSGRVDWFTAGELIVFSSILLLFAVLLLRSAKR